MKLIDLTTPYDAEYSIPQPPFPGERNELRWIATRARDGYNLTEIILSAHTGTHMDAPMHMWSREEKPGMFTLDDIPLERLYGTTVVLDIPKGEEEPIGADDFEKASKRSKELNVRKGDRVLVHTGWGRFYEGPERKNAMYLFFKCPGLDVSGAEWLIDKKIHAYGQDTMGTQYKKKYLFIQKKEEWETGAPEPGEPDIHGLMLKNDIVLLEHLTNLDKVKGRRIIAGFFPLPLKGREGAPMRAIAFLED